MDSAVSVENLDLTAYQVSSSKKHHQELLESPPMLGMDCRPQGQGVLVVKVVPKGPVDVAGICVDDLITHFNDVHIDTHAALLETFSTLQPGNDLVVRLTRKEREVSLLVSVGAKQYSLSEIKNIKKRASDTGFLASSKSPREKADIARAKLASVRPVLGLVLKSTPRERGLLIEKVTADGPCDVAGIQPNDILCSINGVASKDTASFWVCFKSLTAGEKAVFGIWTSDEIRKVTVRIGGEGLKLKQARKLYKAANISFDDEAASAQDKGYESELGGQDRQVRQQADAQHDIWAALWENLTPESAQEEKEPARRLSFSKIASRRASTVDS